ncbi:Transaldolase [Corynebacterium ciconiae DSM 44920]|uniref:transaldolase n=1 Tax=Corynebacterium ciconiae TaxID=227319 RepID=UPI000378661D|nr:transaldolase [Corynebacterium ciconiae]WKD61245.1 Transaldolase [Corynebacterium ciconiae DSM 44920]
MSTIDDIYELGTSTWLDDLSRDRLDSGNLAELIETKSIKGVTTNPAIFAKAMTTGTAYDEQLKELASSQLGADEAVYAMAIDDVRRACDVFAEVFEQTHGVDGRVSIEVDPRISAEREATLVQARNLWKRVDRPNLMIKIPATEESLPAISDALAEGISVNVTLIFSVSRYREVIAAYIEGIQRAAENGHDVSTIHSVASFFVSRLDTEVDARLEKIGSEEALALRGKAGVANARRAYDVFQESFADADLPAGAQVQRPLWASTGVKNPDYPADLYVTELVGPHTVNTMPEGTIDAALEASAKGATLSGHTTESEELFAQLDSVGVDFEDVFDTLEREGVEKFVDSWNDLLEKIDARI